MSVCKEYEARISALIDDELTLDERIKVLEHLDVCPDCKAYWDDLLVMRDTLRAPEQNAPAGFADAVMARVRETKQDKVPAKKILSFPQWKRLATLAACCAVVMLGIWSMDWMPSTNNSMEMAALNGCAAPERAAQGDTMTGAVSDGSTNDCADATPDVDYGVSDDGTAATYNAPESSDESSEGFTEYDRAKDFAQNGDFTAAVMTGSDAAVQWVEDNLNEAWVSGAVYSLTEEQYLKLLDLLQGEDEEFTEIMGENTTSGYLLLAE